MSISISMERKKKLEISKLLAKKTGCQLIAVNGVEKSFNLEAFFCWHHAYMYMHAH